LGRLDWLEVADRRPLFVQLALAARFKEDLGLDSLDAVEVVMAVEEVCNLALRP
jgi:acyl carrier protein